MAEPIDGPATFVSLGKKGLSMAKDARLQGKLAFEHNLPMSACEYPVGSTLREEWMAGWTSAQNARPEHAAAKTGETSAPHA